jgi:glycosyltransferase involved in cell wall biosynthesis
MSPDPTGNPATDRLHHLRALILNSDLPGFPGRAGHEFLNTTNLARLVDSVGVVSLVHSAEQESYVHLLRAAGVDVYVWSRPSSAADLRAAPGSSRRTVLRRVLELWMRTTQVARLPDLRVQDLQFRNIAPHVLDALRGPWHVLIVVQSSSAPWIDYLPPFATSALVLHDIRSVLYRRRVLTGRSFRERLGYLVDSWRYRALELRYCQQFDLVVTVSPADEAWVRKHYRPRRLVTIPIPVDADYFSPRDSVGRARNRVVFSTMNHPPNVDAATFFARQVFPRVRRAIPDAEFWIVGRDPSREVQALVELPGVTVTGTVPDIRDYIAQSSVVVVPLRYGSGLRNKILEAWSMQKCVVSTTTGAEGLNCIDGQNILIANGADQLSETVR